MSDQNERLSFSGRTVVSKTTRRGSIPLGRARQALSGISWFGIFAVVLWFLGLLIGSWGAWHEDWFDLVGGFLLEVGAVVALLISLREDK